MSGGVRRAHLATITVIADDTTERTTLIVRVAGRMEDTLA
jgi:hypothetical protein